MLATMRRSLGEEGTRQRVVALYGFLLSFNVAIWALTLLISIQYPIVLGIAAIAYGSACATPSTPTTSRPSTTPPAS